MEQIVILSGPPGADTGEVCDALCERYDRMLHINVDTLRHMVTAGFRHAWETDRQAREQRALSIRNACLIARESARARYAVVIEDTALAEHAPAYRAALSGTAHAVHWVTLLPSAERAASNLVGQTVVPALARELHGRFAEEAQRGALPGCVLTIADEEDAHRIADRVVDAVARGAARLEPD